MLAPDLQLQKNFPQKLAAEKRGKRRTKGRRLEPVPTGLRTCTAPTATSPSTIESIFRIIAEAKGINIPSCRMKVRDGLSFVERYSMSLKTGLVQFSDTGQVSSFQTVQFFGHYRASRDRFI